MARLRVKLLEQAAEERSRQKDAAWQEHQKLVLGNPVRVYAGMDFIRER